jgi:hypothetical protein
LPLLAAIFAARMVVGEPLVPALVRRHDNDAAVGE